MGFSLFSPSSALEVHGDRKSLLHTMSPRYKLASAWVKKTLHAQQSSMLGTTRKG